MISGLITVVGLLAFCEAEVLKGNTSCYVPSLENGIVTTKEYTEVKFIGTLSCHPGFRLIGNDQVECQKGRWNVKTRNFPFCAAITSCKEDLPKTPHGIWTPVPGYGQSVHRFECIPGYRMFGPRTVFCTNTGWSSGSNLPVCTKGGCNHTELIGSGVEHGGARHIMSGAVYRFYCSKNSVMQGPATVHCDGGRWSSAKPECLVGPSPPEVAVVVDGANSDTNGVIAGQDVVIECDVADGNPVPEVTILINGVKVGDTNAGTTMHTLTIKEDHSDLKISCKAVNKVSSTYSDVHTLKLFYTSPVLEINGEKEVVKGSIAEYSCTSGLAYPTSDMHVHAEDEKGNKIENIKQYKEHQVEDKGVSTKVTFSLHVPDSAKLITLYCKSKHPAGDLETSFNTSVLYTSTHVTISGKTRLLPATEARYVCKAGQANPPATLSWSVKDQGGADVPYTDIDTPEVGVNLSTITLKATDTLDKIDITCAATNDLGQQHHTIMVKIEKPPSNLTLSCPQSVKAGHSTECLCALPASSSQADVSWSVSDALGEAVSADRADNGNGMSLTSKIMFQATALQRYFNVKCTATNILGTVKQDYFIAIEYEPSELLLNVPKAVNKEDLSFDCSTNEATSVKNLNWVINGAKITEGVESSELVTETGGIISQSVVNVTSVGDDEQLVVTCCVQGMGLCKSKTATVLEMPYIVQLEPAEQDAVEPAPKTKIKPNIVIDSYKKEAISNRISDRIPDKSQIEKPEYNSKYQKETIGFENTPLKLVSSAPAVSNQFRTIVLICFTFLY